MNYNFQGKKAIIRVDFNVPLDENKNITDDTRIRRALPTIEKIIRDGGAVILMSHLGRPKGKEDRFSLKPLVGRISELLKGVPVHFADDCIGDRVQAAVASLQPGEVLLLENLRFYPEETKGDESFARQLAELADVYVNDAFGTAHRAHASTAVIARFFSPENKMFGFLMEAEVRNAEKVLHSAEKPFTAILGGAKVSDKISIITRLLDTADSIIIGGGMAYTFFKALGHSIGSSLCEEDKLDLALSILDQAKQKGVRFLLPEDSIVADAFSADAHTRETDSTDIPEGWMGLDIGTRALDRFSEVIMHSKTILWNGPMGVFEMAKFQNGTRGVAEVIAKATKNGAFSLIGGGDSVAAINQFHLVDQVSYVSTGGGAMLEFFEGKTLPGIAAIRS